MVAYAPICAATVGTCCSIRGDRVRPLQPSLRRAAHRPRRDRPIIHRGSGRCSCTSCGTMTFGEELPGKSLDDLTNEPGNSLMSTVIPPSTSAPPRAPDPGAPTRALVLGCAIDRLDMAETLERCDELIAPADSPSTWRSTPPSSSPRRTTRTAGIIDRCELVSADGQAVVWASRLLGDPLPERVAGIDLMHALFALAERRFSRLHPRSQARRARAGPASIWRGIPHLTLAGYRDGYFDRSQDAAWPTGARRPARTSSSWRCPRRARSTSSGAGPAIARPS